VGAILILGSLFRMGWIANLLGTGIHPVSPPSNVSADDWAAVKTQIEQTVSTEKELRDELRYLIQVVN